MSDSNKMSLQNSSPNFTTRVSVNVTEDVDEDEDEADESGSTTASARPKIVVNRSPMSQVEFHEMFEYVPKKNFIPFVANNHLHHQHYNQVCQDFSFYSAVVVAQLVERSLPPPEVRDSNLVIGKFNYIHFLSTILKRRKKVNKKRPRITQFLKD